MSAIATDRYLIAVGTKIEPHIYRTQAEAESAAETLAYHSHHETGIYRLSDAGCVSIWRETNDPGFPLHFILRTDREPFCRDGSSWLDKPAAKAEA